MSFELTFESISKSVSLFYLFIKGKLGGGARGGVCRGARGGVRGVLVIVVGHGHGDTSSNPGRDWLHFTLHKYPWERYESNYPPSSYG